jgi:hypothetical protein
VRLGELDIAAVLNEGRRRVLFGPGGELGNVCVLAVGLPGSELLLGRDGERTELSPDAASVRRNSTHRREKDSVSSVFSNSLF